MGFQRKRGRPKQHKPEHDLGTRELRERRARDLTIEPLDLCLKRGLITASQHECGLRLRWLYALHFGRPHVSAYNPEKYGSRPIDNDSEEWLAARKAEYGRCLAGLSAQGCKRIVLNICVFHQRPSFLLPEHSTSTITSLSQRQLHYQRFSDGMQILETLLGRVHKAK